MRRFFNLIFMLVGLVVLVVLLVRLDTEEVADRMIQVGWFFVVAFACYVVGLLISVFAWRRLIDPEAIHAGYGPFLATFWAGHAINQLTPTASMGEVLKGTILKGRVEGEQLVVSIILFSFLSTLIGAFFMLIGPIVCLVMLDLPMPVVLGLFGAALVAFVPVGLQFFLLRWGVASKVIWLLSRLPLIKLKNPEKLLDRARNVDKRIRTFASQRPGDLVMVSALLLATKILQTIEVCFILWPLLPGVDLGFLAAIALLIQTATQLIIWALTFVPGQVGVQEGGTALLFQWLGFDPLIGFSMELVRRVRRLLGVSIGVAIGSWLGIRPLRQVVAGDTEEADTEQEGQIDLSKSDAPER